MLKRYGRLYFWISLGTSISSLTGGYLYDLYKADTVILLTIIFAMVSTLLLFFIPDVKTVEKKTDSLSDKYMSLFKSVKISFQKPEFVNLVVYSAFLTATYQIFMWSMQPVMKAAMVPVGLFGVIFFLNHISRASGSFFAHQILKKISLKNLGWVVYFGFVLSFFAMIQASSTTNYVLTVCLLVFVCGMIALQVTWLISAIARIHDISTSKNRALLASVNSMAGRLLTALCLIMSKFILDENPMQLNLLIFLILFIPSILILRRFNKSEGGL